MSANRGAMNVNLIDGPDDGFSGPEVRYSVFQNSAKSRKQFCQDPFKVATACLTAFCLILLMILVFRSVHSEATPAAQTTPLPTKSPCPADWRHFNGSCYYVSDSEYHRSWSDSQDFCKRQGGHLAIILTAEEQTFIWNLLPRGHWNAYWFGISDEKVEEDWQWIDGTKLVGGFWEDGEPNNHFNEDCGYMVKTNVLNRVAIKSWYDAPCSKTIPWICEKLVSS